jgi:hypothetical protein
MADIALRYRKLSSERESGYHTRIPLKKTRFCLNLSAGPLK